MKVILPSNGCVGFNSIELREPKINDLRSIPNMSKISELRKNEYIDLLIEDKDKFRSVTLNDRDYLFVLGISILCQGKFEFKGRCSCSQPMVDFIELITIVPTFLPVGTKLEVEKEINGKTQKFRKLRVGDEERAILLALEDEDNYETRYLDGCVAAALDMEINEESLNYIKSEVPLNVYYLSMFFQDCVGHGMELAKYVECTKCKTSHYIYLPTEGNMANVNLAIIMDRFVKLSNKLDFKSFIDLTIPEFNSIIDSLNKSKSVNRKRKV